MSPSDLNDTADPITRTVSAPGVVPQAVDFQFHPDTPTDQQDMHIKNWFAGVQAQKNAATMGPQAALGLLLAQGQQALAPKPAVTGPKIIRAGLAPGLDIKDQISGYEAMVHQQQTAQELEMKRQENLATRATQLQHMEQERAMREQELNVNLNIADMGHKARLQEVKMAHEMTMAQQDAAHTAELTRVKLQQAAENERAKGHDTAAMDRTKVTTGQREDAAVQAAARAQAENQRKWEDHYSKFELDGKPLNGQQIGDIAAYKADPEAKPNPDIEDLLSKAVPRKGERQLLTPTVDPTDPTGQRLIWAPKVEGGTIPPKPGKTAATLEDRAAKAVRDGIVTGALDKGAKADKVAEYLSRTGNYSDAELQAVKNWSPPKQSWGEWAHSWVGGSTPTTPTHVGDMPNSFTQDGVKYVIGPDGYYPENSENK